MNLYHVRIVLRYKRSLIFAIGLFSFIWCNLQDISETQSMKRERRSATNAETLHPSATVTCKNNWHRVICGIAHRD